MRWPLWLLGAIAAASLVWGSCESGRASRAETTRDSSLAVSALKDSLAQVKADSGDLNGARADSLGVANDSIARVAAHLKALLNRPRPVIRVPDSTVADSLRYFRARTTALEVDSALAAQALQVAEAEVGGLKAQLAAQQAATAQFRGAYEGEKDRADGLEKALRAMPTGCPRIPLLGLPIPRFGPGGALTRHGLEPAIAGIIPLGGC